MNQTVPQYPRVLAIAPSTRGFGFAVIEGEETLAIWGLKTARGDQNAWCIRTAEKLISHYQPEVVVLPDHSGNPHRPTRIHLLVSGIADLAPKYGVSVALIKRDQIDKVFFADGKGTRQARAEILAKRFPEDLEAELPPKRSASMREDPRMDIFDAMALAMMTRVKRLW